LTKNGTSGGKSIDLLVEKLYCFPINLQNILMHVGVKHIIGFGKSSIKEQISREKESRKIQTFRTMIGMAEDAYKFKQLEDIKEYDAELQLGKKSAYDSNIGIVYKDGKIYTTDYNEDESKIILRDMEGVIVDTQYSDSNGKQKTKEANRSNP
jgi:outer membrane protein assembly factor BamB